MLYLKHTLLNLRVMKDIQKREEQYRLKCKIKKIIN